MLIAVDVTDRAAGSGRVAWLLLFGVVFLYEPLFVWRRGSAIGHAMNHLTVVSEGTGRRPGLVQSFARYGLNVVLGIPSFLAMTLTRKHHDLHALFSRTTFSLLQELRQNVTHFTSSAWITSCGRPRRARAG